MPDPLPPAPLSRARLHRRLLRNYILGVCLTLASGALLFTFGLDLSLRQALLLFLLLGPLAFVPTIAVDVWMLNRHVAPIEAALASAPGVNYHEALIQALNLPYRTGRRIVLVHFPTFYVSITALVLIANAALQFDLTFAQYINLSLIALLVAGGHAIFEYFAADWALRPVTRWLWQAVGELSADERQRIIRLGMQRKLVLISVFAVFAPLTILGVTTLVRAHSLLTELGPAVGLTPEAAARVLLPLQIWVALFVIFAMGVMLTLAVVMALGITRSVTEMVQAMRRVEDGDFDVQLPLTTTDEFANLFQGFNLMTEGLNERERLRDAIGRYLAPELAEEVMKRGVQLGGQTIGATMLFADIRGFTTISEKLSPEEVVDFLNRYFAAVEPAIQQCGGWINKFGGDSLLAVFGAPVPHADHARRALQAALGMRAALAEFNRQQAAAGEPQVQIGVGIHTGDIVAGNVGSPTRMEYTVIGDVVNVASRIDGLNKDWGTDILVSADAWTAAGVNGEIRARAMPPVALKGKTQLTQVYAIE